MTRSSTVGRGRGGYALRAPHLDEPVIKGSAKGDLRSPNQIATSNGMKAHWKRRREQALHMAVAEYLGHALRPPVFWTTFPAGGGGKLRGAFLKGMGLKAGVPDILIFAPNAFSTFVVGIELKAGKGRVSPFQEDTMIAMGEANVHCRVCRSVDQVQDILLANGVPIHARVAINRSLARAA